jgi:FAD/FMN-containing dehydrogenase
VDELKDIVGVNGIQGSDTVAGLDPGWHQENLAAGLIVLPVSTHQVAGIVAYCNRKGVSLVPHGGRTGLSGGGISTPGAVILQTTRMNRVLSIDPLGGTAIVETGIVLEALEAEVAKHNLSVGIDLGARGSATIGGMVSTNAGGIEAFRNGMTRHRVLGLEVVLPNGQILDDLKTVTKANEGYDIKQLFIGAEGTLGVITKVSLSLVPKEGKTATALTSCLDVDKAVRTFRRFRNHRDGTLLSAELMWPDYSRITAEELGHESVLTFETDPQALFLILEVADDKDDGGVFLENLLSECADKGEIRNAIIAKSDRERESIWKIREEPRICENRFPHGFWFDISVPLGELKNYTDKLFEDITRIQPELRALVFGHLGDGNLHITVTSGKVISDLEDPIRRAVFRNLNELAGSFSAEHGIGIDKRESLARYTSPEKLKIMRNIKKILDPKGIMNPGKVLASADKF